VEVPPHHLFEVVRGDFTGIKYAQVRQILRRTLFFDGSRSGTGDDIHRKEVTVAGYPVEPDCLLAVDGRCG
jgi:hypothetical protein